VFDLPVPPRYEWTEMTRAIRLGYSSRPISNRLCGLPRDVVVP
jgi:hypothetical protein